MAGSTKRPRAAYGLLFGSIVWSSAYVVLPPTDCAGAFGVKDEVQELGVHMLDEYEHDPSIRPFVAQGFEVLTF